MATLNVVKADRCTGRFAVSDYVVNVGSSWLVIPSPFENQWRVPVIIGACRREIFTQGGPKGEVFP